MMRLEMWFGDKRVVFEGDIKDVLKKADEQVIAWQSER